jgi:pimeloyl-ACP methyl ester carboxylesterase
MTVSVTLRHNRLDLALHCLRDEPSTRPLLLLHGLGERSPATVPPHVVAGWPAAVWALDFTGHGASQSPAGGGYSCEVLMGDADHAVAELGEATLFGRGLGAYIALLLAGARPSAVCGAILADGPGLTGGGPAPGSPTVLSPSFGLDEEAPPDPLAIAELGRDIRPPDYATTFARLAATASALDAPIAVAGINRPPWLAAVVDEPGVVECNLPTALSMFAASSA